MKSAEQNEQERADRIAAAEAKALRQAGEDAPKKKPQDAEASDAGDEAKPKRGKRKEAAGAGVGGGNAPKPKRTGPRKVGGG